jgi:hypothetical protein
MQTSKIGFLVSHLIILTAMIHFQMANGIPFAILSSGAFLWHILRTRQWRHVLAWIVFPVGLSNYILFEVRHGFLLSRGVIDYISRGEVAVQAWGQILWDRIVIMIARSEIVRSDPFGYANAVLFIALAIGICFQLRHGRYRTTYLALIYFYVGFFVLSLINRSGPMLYFYQFPLFPLLMLALSSLVTSVYTHAFYAVVGVVLLMNMRSLLDDTAHASRFSGRDFTSWVSVKTAAEKVFEAGEKEIGYLVYAPDSFAYAPHYAMDYLNRVNGNPAARSIKRTITYVLIEPPPQAEPWISHEWWIQNKAKITSSPVEVFTLPSGYIVHKYNLSGEEVSVLPDQDLDLRLHFR